MAALLDMAIALMVIITIMLVTELISKLTRGRIPQMFLMALVFMVGFWLGLPKDIVETSHLMGIADITKTIILIHIATIFDIKALKQEWRVVVTTLAALVGIGITVFAVCGIFFDMDYAVASIPPLMGGMAAAFLMTEAAPTQTLTLLVLLVWILQAFVGYPLASMFVRKEGVRLSAQYKKDPVAARAALGQGNAPAEDAPKKKLLIDRVPDIIKSPTFILFQMLLLAAVAAGLTMLCNILFSAEIDLAPIFSIIVGVAARSLGLIDASPLDKAQSSGIMFIALYASMMVGFAGCTPQQVLSLLGPIAVILTVSTAGILGLCIPVGKKLGYSGVMSAAIGLNCYLGFPINYAITSEQITLLTNDEEERKYLNDAIMSKMIIGGITSVSVVSCIIASIFINLF